MQKLLVSINNEAGHTANLLASDYIEASLQAFGRTMGHITIDLEDDGTQYIIKWFPCGLDHTDKAYRDPVILAEGHIEDGDIQRLR